MKTAIRRTALALFSATIATASFSVLAAEIVIDSGDSATIISSLPDSAAQEELVCSDTFSGQLGKCSGPAQSILGFYRKISKYPENPSNAVMHISCDDGDVATGGGVDINFINHDSVVLLDSHPGNFGPEYWQADVTPIGENDNVWLIVVCADYFPLHES